MKKEAFKVGMRVRYKDESFIYKVVDLKYVDKLLIVEREDGDFLTSIPECLYHCLEEVKEVPKIEGYFKVYQCPTNKRKIIAKYIDNKDMTYVGSAICNPEDGFVFETGAALATQRALNAKQAWDELTSYPIMDLMNTPLLSPDKIVLKKGNK